MVSGELSVTVVACLIRSQEKGTLVQAVLHAQVGQQHLQTKAIKSQSMKQFAWQEILLFKVNNEGTIRFWLSDELRKGEQRIIGECVINLEVIKNEKFPLFLYSKQKETAVIDVELALDSRGSSYVLPQQNTRKLILQFLIKSAELSKNMELIGNMRPSVRIAIGKQVHQTSDSKGKTPVWEQEVIFEGVTQEDEVLMTVLDKEMIGKDDIVGTAYTTVESLKVERSYVLDIKSKDLVAGTLKFDVKQYYE